MKRQRDPRRMLLALVPVLMLWAGCATTSTVSDGAQNQQAGLTVRVDNNLTVPSSVTVWLVPENGATQLLGTASPSGQESFSVKTAIVPGQYVLRARTTEGQVYESTPFTLTSDMDSVSWDLQLNTVRT